MGRAGTSDTIPGTANIKAKRGLAVAGLALWAVLFLAACEEVPTPKPVGYYRIALPEHAYKFKSPDCPFTFDISTYSRLEQTRHPDTVTGCWLSVAYPRFDARVYLTYKPVHGDLHRYLEESRSLTYEHQIKASRIDTREVVRDSAKVYGLTYDLGGSVASPFQFYLTDSTSHFLRGSLYFNARPNPDSTAPTLAYIRKDMDRLIASLEWK